MKIDADWISRFMDMHWRSGDYKVYDREQHGTVGVVIYLPVIKDDFTNGMLMGQVEFTTEMMNKDNASDMFRISWVRAMEILHKETTKAMGIFEEKKILLQILSRSETKKEVIQEAINKAMMELSEKDLEEVNRDFKHFWMMYP